MGEVWNGKIWHNKSIPKFSMGFRNCAKFSHSVLHDGLSIIYKRIQRRMLYCIVPGA